MHAIDRVLQVLATDEAWHSVEEIAERASLPKQETAEIISFLAANRLISIDEHGKEVKIKQDIDKFLAQIQKEEEESTS